MSCFPTSITETAYLPMPKTGSRWVKWVLRKLGYDRICLPKHDISQWWALKHSEKFIFTTIRRPDEWLRSYYYYSMEPVFRGAKDINWIIAPTSILVQFLDENIDTFYENVLSLPGALDAIFTAYASLADLRIRTDMLADGMGNLLVGLGFEPGVRGMLRGRPKLNESRVPQQAIPKWLTEELYVTNPLSWDIWENSTGEFRNGE